MSTDFKLAQRISKDVELQTVTLHSAEMASHFDPRAELPADLEVKQGYRARFEVRDSAPDHLYVFIDLKFTTLKKISDSPADQPSLFSLDATFLLLYTLPAANNRDPTDLHHFARLNGTYNVWPYWRELVQTVSGRVGLATVVVPVLRLKPTRIAEPAPTQELKDKSDGEQAVARPPRKNALAQ